MFARLFFAHSKGLFWQICEKVISAKFVIFLLSAKINNPCKLWGGGGGFYDDFSYKKNDSAFQHFELRIRANYTDSVCTSSAILQTLVFPENKSTRNMVKLASSKEKSTWKVASYAFVNKFSDKMENNNSLRFHFETNSTWDF